jgi:hypothetical protein
MNEKDDVDLLKPPSYYSYGCRMLKVLHTLDLDIDLVT